MFKLKIIGVITLVLFSFVYISKINEVILQQNSLYSEIVSRSLEYEKKSYDAVIIGDYIIPGISGLKVNILESYYNMRHLNFFDEKYLVYDKIYPTISVFNNIDKFINKGNNINRGIALVLNSNNAVENFLVTNGIKYSKLITKDVVLSKNFEAINNDDENFSELDKIVAHKICIIGNHIKKMCIDNNYLLVDPEITLTNDNISVVKSNIYSGQIIQISDFLSLDNFKNLYNEIIFRNYNIYYLSELLQE